jgi:2-polyprenyl-6-hydroxyphenyl methylase/3-demethylubiquinone-9 3-methyltransferase
VLIPAADHNGDMSDYYTDSLAAGRLRRVYEIAPPRVRQYLAAEVEFVMAEMRLGDRVLDLGCGYGRVIPRLAERAGLVVGIDMSLASLRLASEMIVEAHNCLLMNADALALPLRSRTFDTVACIQNGISAFHVDHGALMAEAIRVTRPGGTVLISTYSEKFWDQRLAWFRLQAAAGLVGEIDETRTGDGVIVCKDGFTGTAVKPASLASLTARLDVCVRLVEVDQSSLFLKMVPR